jgi:hypothetical protein
MSGTFLMIEKFWAKGIERPFDWDFLSREGGERDEDCSARTCVADYVHSQVGLVQFWRGVNDSVGPNSLDFQPCRSALSGENLIGAKSQIGGQKSAKLCCKLTLNT